jgi:hypothetical protein
LLPSKRAAFDNITFNRITRMLVDGYRQTGNREQAEERLRTSLAYLERQVATGAVLREYREELAKAATQKG